MAIILSSHDAAAIETYRPMLRIVDGAIDLARAGAWRDPLADAHALLERAIRAVGRIDTEGAVTSFVGTAVVVAPRLAVTVSYIGDALRFRARDLKPGERLAVIDFGEAPPGDGLRVAVERVEMIHPRWGAAFLVLDADVPADRIATLAPPDARDRIAGRTVCVVGYPSLDPRSERAAIDRVLDGAFDVKRAMPGVVTGIEPLNADMTATLRHDASTLGGAGGAPLIDMADGTVLGLQYAGRFLTGNQAAPAWELARDPQWARLWQADAAPAGPSRAEVARAAVAAPPADRPSTVFAHPRLLALGDLLIASGFDGADDIALLLVGLPPELTATLPTAASPRAQLVRCLDTLNRMMFLLGDALPIHFVMANAQAQRGYDPRFAPAIQPFLAEERARRAEVAA